MDKDDGPILWEYEVRAAGEASMVESIPKSGCMQQPPEYQLGTRIAPSDARHPFGSLSWA